MRRLTTILLLTIGCAQHSPDLCRVAELQTLLSASPERAVSDTVLQDRTSNLLPLNERVDNETDAEFKVGDYCLYDYYRSSPPCPPCIRWGKTEHDRVSCKVKQWDTSKRPVKFVTAVPTFRLLWCNTETKEWDDLKLWTGFVSADTINKQIAAHKKQQTQSQVIPVSLSNQQLRLTEYDLRSWINEHYTPMSRLDRATVTPQSWVWTHLKQDQVGGLPLWMALALHDAVHPRSSPLITPWETR